ncbi:MAG TPA: hypothetical protein PLS53_18685 [Thermoanaerobaculaceae bacterium]|nr:hypothetical protein [Thermoanaerobaculaceae bacterium]
MHLGRALRISVAAALVIAATSAGASEPRRSLDRSIRLSIEKASYSAGSRTLEASGTAPSRSRVTLSRAVNGTVLTTVTSDGEGKWRTRIANPQPVPCRIRAQVAGTSTKVERSVDGAPASCDGVAALTGLTVNGPTEVEENSTAAFTATATFGDGTSRDVSGAASWTEAVGFVSVIAGVVTTTEVTGDQTFVLGASFTAGSVTKTASMSVRVKDGDLVVGSHAGRFASFEGTRTCLGCHLSEAQDMHGSVHYQWLGDASEARGLSTPLAGKLGGINDFCIYPDINWIGKLTNTDGVQVDGGCARCHTGLGLKPTPDATQAQLENIDCLICHAPQYKRTVASVNGAWRFVPDEAKMGVSILQAAVDIHLPSKATCLNCHTKAGGGDNYKRGDIEEAHRNPTAAFDVHMAPRSAGGAGLECLDCHSTAGHRIGGRGVDMRERDLSDTVACTNCHPTQPHDDSQLNRHTARVACNTCHVPEFAKVAATDMVRDWSLPGDLDPLTKLYEPHMLKASHVQPEYRFFNGTSEFYEFGTPAVPQANGKVLMAGPIGSVQDTGARIIPVKHHLGRQPQDPTSGRLLPLKIGVFFQSGDIDQAIVQGAAAVGWPYSGHTFAETERYLGIYHEVAPSSQALQCASCHDQNRLDWASLGYTPRTTRNGKALCESCHERESMPGFESLHDKHVRDKKLDCSNCHTFSKA